MCFPPGARPPEIPADLLPISGGAGGEDVIITSADGAKLRSHLATAGVHAIAFDYFGRIAGTDHRSDDWAYQEHVPAVRARPDLIQADVAASAAELRKRTGATRVFVLGFCMGGRVAFNASAEQDGLAGVVGFYGVLRKREHDDPDAPIDKVARMKAPILGLFGGADPGIPADSVAEFDRALDARKLPHHLVIYPGAPHSFFDRTFAQYKKECDDAWRRVLGFVATGDPKAVK